MWRASSTSDDKWLSVTSCTGAEFRIVTCIQHIQHHACQRPHSDCCHRHQDWTLTAFDGNIGHWAVDLRNPAADARGVISWCGAEAEYGHRTRTGPGEILQLTGASLPWPFPRMQNMKPYRETVKPWKQISSKYHNYVNVKPKQNNQSTIIHKTSLSFKHHLISFHNLP